MTNLTAFASIGIVLQFKNQDAKKKQEHASYRKPNVVKKRFVKCLLICVKCLRISQSEIRLHIFRYRASVKTLKSQVRIINTSQQH